MNISAQQARLRFTTISERLQDAVFSVQTAEIMDGIAQQYHLDDLKTKTVAKIAGWVLLGFIHPEDVAQEIQTQTQMPSQVAADIAKSLDGKVFNMLREELKVAYAPVPLPHEEISATGPKMIQEIVAPQPVSTNTSVTTAPKPPAPPSVPLPKIAPQSGQGFSVNLSSMTKPVATSNIPAKSAMPPAPPAPAPANLKSALSSAGWSKMSPDAPMIKLNAIKPNIPGPAAAAAAPAPTATPKPTGAQPNPQGMKGMGEFERLDLMKKGEGAQPVEPQKPTAAPLPPPPPPAAASPKAPDQGPVMLHRTEGAPQMSKSSDVDFSLVSRNEMTVRSQPPSASEKSATKAAILELGSAAGAAPKVARYSDNKTTMPPPILPSAGPRQITEFTGQAAPIEKKQVTVPPPPPAPPSMGTPNVVVKNFTEPPQR